jgi:hypothetical protein
MKLPLPQKQKIVWPDNAHYFLTTSTFLHYPYFRDVSQKQIVLNKIKQTKQALDISISAFSISINHFHIKFYLRMGKLMTQMKNIIHSGVSREHRKIYNVKYKEFWQSTRTFYIRDEKTS